MPPAAATRKEFEDRFWSKVLRYPACTNRCWPWTGYRTQAGYGMLTAFQKQHLAHRLVFEMVGKEYPPKSMDVDHLCRNPRCVNPKHLEVVTHRENMLRGIGPAAIHAKQTYCKRGHAFDEANTYRRKSGARMCRACNTPSARRK